MKVTHWLQARSLSLNRDTIALAALIVSFAVLCVALPRILPALAALEEWTRDVRIAALTPSEPQNTQIVIVAIDEPSLSISPYRLPADRGQIAALVTRLSAAGAGAIGINIPLDSLTEPAKDKALKSALLAAKVPVILAARRGNDEQNAIQRAFSQGLKSGDAALPRDTFDGTLRFVRTQLAADRDGINESFAAAIAATLGTPQKEARLRISWHGRPDGETRPFASFPAYVVKSLPSEWFTGKIVLIGYDLPEFDRHPTPFNVAGLNAQMASTEIQAHILAQLLEGRDLATLPLWLEALSALIICLLAAAIARSPSNLWVKILAGIGLIIAVWTGSFMLYSWGGPLAPVVMPTLAIAGVTSVTTTYLGRQERERRAMIRHAFARYVPPAVVARLERDPAKLELGGERRELTILFTDLSGFTTLAENTDPHLIADFLNDYLDVMANAVLAHGGTIDKFIGDGVMCFFGAPEPQDDAAARAIACAAEMDERAREVEAAWREKGLDVGITRIGIHTGPVIVGNFGGRQRFDYTALGDTVNVAARIEGANKIFGTRILLSAETIAHAPGANVRPAGDVVLKGRGQAMRLYELCTPARDTRDYAAYFSRLAAGDMAPDEMRALAAKAPSDPLIAFHLSRVEQGIKGTLIAPGYK
ncbi:MAG: CHASE2 domain-containing protein [Alphaproteobacteria bacterium]|nr:CHASE2 domain-containing protein [Alphaproteobacteria bacterium]